MSDELDNLMEYFSDNENEIEENNLDLENDLFVDETETQEPEYQSKEIYDCFLPDEEKVERKVEDCLLDGETFEEAQDDESEEIELGYEHAKEKLSEVAQILEKKAQTEYDLDRTKILEQARSHLHFLFLELKKLS